MEFLFSDHRIQRVVEPDVRNEKVHKLNEKQDLHVQKIQLLEKEAILEFCTREQFKSLQNQII
jgi:hypothetical protein